MTREEAIHELLNAFKYNVDDLFLDACNIAIEALQEPKTIIGIDIPYGSDKGVATVFKRKDDEVVLEEVKEIMAVVRCKDCKHAYKRKPINKTAVLCEMFGAGMKDNDFCSYGERSEE